jgi:hypothetical protein
MIASSVADDTSSQLSPRPPPPPLSSEATSSLAGSSLVYTSLVAGAALIRGSFSRRPRLPSCHHVATLRSNTLSERHAPPLKTWTPLHVTAPSCYHACYALCPPPCCPRGATLRSADTLAPRPLPELHSHHTALLCSATAAALRQSVPLVHRVTTPASCPSPLNWRLRTASQSL